jgi:DNA primase
MIGTVPRLSQETIERIAAASDVVDVIGAYFPLKRAGAVFKALCPFHQERSPSFTVNPQRQIFKCFGCGAGGSVFKFVEMYEHLSFPDAVRKLADKAGIPIIEEDSAPGEDRKLELRKRLLGLHAEAAEWFHRNLLKTEAAQPARDYLKMRGVTAEVARDWKLGYAPDEWDALGAWARGAGYSAEELLASGLVKQREEDASAARSDPQRGYDRFRDRVMFPICNDYGEVVAFSGRVLAGDDQAAKYINSPETPLFTKGHVLFGLHRSKRALIERSSAIVCEGQLDLITAFSAGVTNVIAPQGTAFTERQAQILKRFVREVVLCFDSDAAGQKAAERSLPALLNADLIIRVAALPHGHDPDSLIRQEGPEAFRALINGAPDFFDYQIERQSRSPEFATPRGKVEFARQLGEWVGLLSDQILRDALVHKVAARLGMPTGDFQKSIRTPRKTAGSASTPERTQAAPLPLSLARLCQLALTSTHARDALLAEPWTAFLENYPEGALLGKVLSAEVTAGDPQSITAFLAGLTTEEQSQITDALNQKTPSDPERVAKICWDGLRRDSLIRKREALQARMRDSTLPAEKIMELQREYASIQKEVLDLQKGFTHIARPLSSDL